MAASEQTGDRDFSYSRRLEDVEEAPQASMAGIVIIGVSCAVISAIIAYLLEAGIWLMLLAYIFGGWAAMLVSAVRIASHQSNTTRID